MRLDSTRRRSLVTFIAGALFGVLAITCSQPKTTENRTGSRDAVGTFKDSLVPAAAFARAGKGELTMADVAERTVSSVVNVSATQVTKVRGRSPMFEDPMFREFFGPMPDAPRERRGQSLGSGVIVSTGGIILTNNHVVENAEEIKITLSDGRDLEAEVVGTDPKSDLAVLRVKGKTSGLQALPIGDSSALRLGDVVLAIGNPFGVGQTVTMGIVSATGRSNIPIVDYADFIQTDAAINPGNSGGALINMRGELVGINTAILSRTGAYNGVGFAIPTKMAKPIMDSLLEDGKVERGFLGVGIQNVDKDIAAAMELPVKRGVLISDVQPGSPANKGGLERGDVVVKLDGVVINTSSELRNRVAASRPGTTVVLDVIRDGKQQRVEVALGELPEDGQVAASGGKGEGAGGSKLGLLSGAAVVDLERVRGRLDVPRGVTDGVVVTGVQPGSPAAQLGLRQGDIVLEINRQPVKSVAQFNQLAAKTERRALVLVSRDGIAQYMALEKR